jgi:hypothetical protein
MTSRIIELNSKTAIRLLNDISTYMMTSEPLLKAADDFPHTDSELDSVSEKYLFEHCISAPLPEMYLAEYQNVVNCFTYGDETILKMVNRMKHYLGLEKIDLIAFYPKNSKLSWHHNSNSPGYHLLFSYSIDGNGFFRYYDVGAKSVVTVDDPIGWTAKINYLPDPKLGKDIFWHCVGTKNYRISFGYTIPFNKVNQIMELLALDK